MPLQLGACHRKTTPRDTKGAIMNPVMSKATRVGSKSIVLPVDTFPEDGFYIARCAALGVSDHGATQEEAVSNLAKTVALFFESCQRRGTTLQFLQERGILPAGRQLDDVQEEGVFVPVLSWGRTDASSFGI